MSNTNETMCSDFVKRVTDIPRIKETVKDVNYKRQYLKNGMKPGEISYLITNENECKGNVNKIKSRISTWNENLFLINFDQYQQQQTVLLSKIKEYFGKLKVSFEIHSNSVNINGSVYFVCQSDHSKTFINRGGVVIDNTFVLQIISIVCYFI